MVFNLYSLDRTLKEDIKLFASTNYGAERLPGTTPMSVSLMYRDNLTVIDLIDRTRRGCLVGATGNGIPSEWELPQRCSSLGSQSCRVGGAAGSV